MNNSNIMSVVFLHIIMCFRSYIRAKHYRLLISFALAFLLYESPDQPVVRIRCSNGCSPPVTWTLSPDGSRARAVELNTSSDRYNVVNDNSLEITLSNLTGADGGVYSCVCSGGAIDDQLCVYVFGEC